jgi:DUF4097 and DUF4098 domain-containing protein YvlB
MNGPTSRFVALGLGLVFAVLAGRADAAEVRRVSERLVAFSPGGVVRIDDTNGRLTVEGWSRHDVRIQITRVVRAEDDAKAEELMKELQSDVEVRKNRIDVISRFPKRRETIGLWDILGRKVASLQIHYYVQVPNQTNLVLKTTNGEVRVRGVDGKLDATTTNGDMRIGNLKGEVTLGTTNGEIELTGISGEAVAQTTNGSVSAQLRGVASKGIVEIRTTNGNVTVYLPGDLKALLDATTTNGRVSIDFPVVRQGIGTSKSIRGTIHGGGATISLGTTNGNVEVRKLGERRP